MLKDKVALVTGCNRGIGKSVAEKFAESGAIVYANARELESLKPLCDRNSWSGKIVPIYFDVTDRSAVRRAFIKIKNERGRLDCLVNNAGILVDTLITMLDRATLKIFMM